MNKRGLSSVVTTIILILLILVAIGIIWTVINNIILKEGIRDISLRKLTVDIDMASAQMNFTTGIVTVKVKRNPGEGNLTGIKILVGDDKTTEVFTKYFEKFYEGGERTITINLTEEATDLVISNIEKISLAPIIILESGKEVIGPEIKGIENLNDGFNLGSGEGSGEEDEEGEGSGENEACTEEDLSICESEGWINFPACTENNQIIQDYKTVSCLVGLCYYGEEQRIKENCSEIEKTCIDSECIEELEPCLNDSDCPPDTSVGENNCLNSTSIGQNYQIWSCNNNVCEYTIENTLETICPEEQICEILGEQAECFIPLDCASNSDCDPGYVCISGFCMLETPLNNGTINSVWPFFVGEYFDGANIPTQAPNYLGYYVIFPGSAETRCLQVLEHVYPEKIGAYSYIRLSVSDTNLSNGDNYQIWETDNACLLI